MLEAVFWVAVGIVLGRIPPVREFIDTTWDKISSIWKYNLWK